MVGKGFSQEFSVALDEFVKSVREHTRWNFMVPFKIRACMMEMDAERFSKWMSSGDLSDIEFPIIPPEICAALAKIRTVVGNIVQKDAKCLICPNLSSLVDDFHQQANNIHVVNFQDSNTHQIFLDLIEKTTGSGMRISDPQERYRLFAMFADLFSEPTNQKLSDHLIENKMLHMFDLLRANPKISAAQFAKKILTLWSWPAESNHSICTDLSELLVRYNPYNLTTAQLLLQACNDKSKKILNKSIIYRARSFSMKIVDTFAKKIGDGKYTLTCISPQGDQVLLELESVHEGKNIISESVIAMSYSKETEYDMVKFLREKLYISLKKFKVEFKFAISSLHNPFVLGTYYSLDVVETGSSYLPYSSAYTDYIFTPDFGEPITFRITKGNKKQFVINPGKKVTRSRKLYPCTQKCSWPAFQSFLSVITTEEVNLSSNDTGLQKFDDRYLSLSDKTLSTKGEVQRSLQEKDECTAEILTKLLEDKSANIFSTICAHPDRDIAEDLFIKIFSKNYHFLRLCNNQCIKSLYGKKASDFLSSALRKKIALDFMHQALVFKLARLQPKEHKGNRDLIESLCEAMFLVDGMKGTCTIPFVGTTGSGKSATVSYMMGVPMIKCTNEYGDSIIKHKKVHGDGIPKIGFSIGLSETIHAQVYSLLPAPPFQKDPNKPWVLAPPRHYPKFANGLTNENFRLGDLPGFYDTRGTHYEVITNFSIDRAMESFARIPALVQVVPYESLTTDKARMLYSLLADLKTKFPNLLEDETLQDGIHFAITKFGLHSINQVRKLTETLVNEYNQRGLEGAKYFSFLLRQIDVGNVHLLNPLSSTSRLKILDSIIDKYNPSPKGGDPFKKAYKGAFNNPRMQLQLGNLIHGAILSWDNLLNRFLGSQKKLRKYAGETKETKEVIMNLKASVVINETALANLKAKQGKSFDPNDPLFKKVAEEIQKCITEYENDIKSLRLEVESLRKKIKCNEKSIRQNKVDISKLTSGRTESTLHDCVRKRGDSVKYRRWNVSPAAMAAKIARQLDNNAAELSEHEGELGIVGTYIVGTDNIEMSCSMRIERGHELVPQDLPHAEQIAKLNELVKTDGWYGFKQVLLKDGWFIDVNVYGKIEFTGVRVHDSGKVFMYSYREKCPAGGPFTGLTITLVLPNAVFNSVKVLDIKSTIEKLRNDSAGYKSEKSVKEGTLKGKQDELSKLRIRVKSKAASALASAIENSHQSLQASKASLSYAQCDLQRLEFARHECERDLRECAVAIRYHEKTISGTVSCARHFKPMDSESMFAEKGRDVLRKCQKFVCLYDNNIEGIRTDIKQILDVKDRRQRKQHTVTNLTTTTRTTYKS